jgi:hypothetical protein
MPTSTDVSQRAPHIRGITPKELEGLVAVMKLTETVADKVRFIIYVSVMLCNVLLYHCYRCYFLNKEVCCVV